MQDAEGPRKKPAKVLDTGTYKFRELVAAECPAAAMCPEAAWLPVLVKTTAEEGAELPVYATAGSAGADVKAFIKEPITLAPHESVLVPTGLRMQIPAAFEIQIRSRSGLALKHQVVVLNAPGTIDSDYRGPIGVILINHGKEPFVIEPGMRVAQMILCPIDVAHFGLTGKLAASDRGEAGFGSTGA